MRTNARLAVMGLLAFSLLGTGSPVKSEDAGMARPPGEEQAGHVVVTPTDVKWTQAPSSLPTGAQIFVMEGDPSQPGPFTMRLQFPANYQIPAHSHPVDEHVTVISGTLHLGMGDKFDQASAQALSAGSFAVMPANTRHFAFAGENTVIQLHGMGPWDIVYVNPADDPRGQGLSSRLPSTR